MSIYVIDPGSDSTFKVNITITIVASSQVVLYTLVIIDV